MAPGADVQALSDVLKDRKVGGFKVKTVVNQSWSAVLQAIAWFFANREPEDFLLLYFSCHGIKSDDGHLYFATSDTNRKILRASAVPDDFVQEQMRTSRARQQVLILDCCYGGFFTNRMLAKSDSAAVDDVDRFQNQGAVILTGSSAIQYSFESNGLKNNSTLSVFTSSLVKGLLTGAADLDGDGLVSAVDLFGYARREMRDASRTQTPTLSTIGQEGEIYIAAVPPSRGKKRPVGSVVLPSPDGWIDLTKFVDRSEKAVTNDAVLIAMETSLAFHGKRISLSRKDLFEKLAKLSQHKVEEYGYAQPDMMYLIDHLGVKAERSRATYSARSYRLASLDEITGQLRMGRPVVAGMTWRQRWLKQPISKTGTIDLKSNDMVAGGSMITIVGCNEVDMTIRFVWHFEWGDRGLGTIGMAAAAECIHEPYSIEAAEMTRPSSRI